MGVMTREGIDSATPAPQRTKGSEVDLEHWADCLLDQRYEMAEHTPSQIAKLHRLPCQQTPALKRMTIHQATTRVRRPPTSFLNARLA